MNRNQRKYGYNRPKSPQCKSKKNELCQVCPELTHARPYELAVPCARHNMQSRCCYISPTQRSFTHLTNSHITETSKKRSPIGSERPKSSNPVQEPAKPKPEIITIAGPKRSKFNNVPAKNKSYQRSLPAGGKTQADVTVPLVKSSLSSQRVVNSSTDPYISNPDFYSSDNTRGGHNTYPDVTLAQIQELQKIILPGKQKMEKASQYADSLQCESVDITQWHTVDDAGEVDNVIRGRDEETLTQYHNLPRKLHISETPRIQIMAEKFNKYKNNDVEVRRLEEKVVCVEYDVFDEEGDSATPVQRIRAFFSIKPADGKDAKGLTELPSTIKSKFDISAGDLLKLNQKEIEILDEKILENQPYLDDLRKLLRRRENMQKNKNTLNLQALYEMGKRDLLDFNTNFDPNIMPKEELITMQNIILNNCKSSVHGIRRKTIKSSSKIYDCMTENTMSRSLVNELLRESNKTVTDF